MKSRHVFFTVSDMLRIASNTKDGRCRSFVISWAFSKLRKFSLRYKYKHIFQLFAVFICSIDHSSLVGEILLSCESSLPKGDVRHSLGPPAYGSPLSKVYIPFCSPSRVTAEMGQQRFGSLFWQMNLWGQWQNWHHGRQCLCIYCIISG